MTGAKPLFSFINVTCRRGGRDLCRQWSLDIAAGDIVHLAGDNGTGKTSLLRMAAGLLPLYRGHLAYDGIRFSGKRRAGDDQANSTSLYENIKRQIAFLPAEDRHLKPRETIYENLSFWQCISGGDVDRAMGLAGLQNYPDRPVRQLSAGQRRRLSLARIYLQNARMWFLDEPLNGLDEKSAADFMTAVRTHVADGGAVMIAGHQVLAAARRVTMGGAG